MRVYRQTSYVFQIIRTTITLLFCCLNFHGYTSNIALIENNKPELKAINFVQNEIEVTHSNKTAYFSLRVCSNEILSTAVIYFQSPSGKGQVQTTCINKKKTNVAFFLGKILFKKKSEIGIWKINRIVIENIQGKQTSYDQKYLIKKKLSHTLRIISKPHK